MHNNHKIFHLAIPFVLTRLKRTVEPCNTHDCPDWSRWSSSTCSQSCGTGEKVFTSTCRYLGRPSVLCESKCLLFFSIIRVKFKITFTTFNYWYNIFYLQMRSLDLHCCFHTALFFQVSIQYRVT